ncbi:MAG: polysaccharide deacetylase family protein [Alphaproteobacteria bacterium]|nr:polysaccharide deacetylase family protein [Alphaproteobacteria bacterium]
MRFPMDRVPYSAIVDRPALTLPDGQRMAVWLCVNVEDWEIRKAQPRTVLPPPQGVPLDPDLPNWAWHEYGNRVGFWRIAEALKARGITPTMPVNGRVIETHERIAQYALDEGWEFMGHGYVQGPMHRVEDQRTAIRRTIDVIENFTGKAPVGWESPGLTETYETIDLLAQEGIQYVVDWVLDDQPFEIDTVAGKILSVPYTVETNDITMMAIQHHSADEMYRRTKDQFDRLYRESETITRVMCISIHPYITGVPHRIGYLEQILDYIQGKPDVALWTGEQVMNWYRAQKA